MALPNDTTWEVQPGVGSDTACSGGFAASMKGATGVDYSTLPAAKYTYAANLSATGTTTLTSGSAAFTNDVLGNLIAITGQGTYCVTGFTSASAVTVDRALGTFSGATGYLGGALATLNQAFVALAGQHTVYLKATGTADTSLVASKSVPQGTQAAFTQVIGYTSNRTPTNTDAAPQVTTTNVSNVLNCQGYCRVYNLRMTQAGTAGSQVAVQLFNPYCIVERCRFDAWGNTTVNFVDNYQQVVGNYFNQCGGLQTGNNAVHVIGNSFYRCTGNPVVAYTGGIAGACLRNLVQGNAASTTAISWGSGGLVAHNTVYGHSGGGGVGFTYASGVYDVPGLNNLAHSCATGYKLAGNASASVRLLNCAAYNCGTDYDAGYPPAAVAGFVHCTADPCTNAAGGDLSLNNAAGGGALLRGTGYPASYPP